MFGSYILPGKANPNFFKKLISKIKKRIKYNDILIVCDYGHNLVDTASAKFISDLKKFTTLNAQLNSSNIGYHGLNKYNYIDVVVINESELRQELRDNKSDLDILAQYLINKNKIKNLVVTQGKQGSTLFRKNFKPISCPAFSNYAVDKVGAGDAMLSIISLAMSKKLDLDISLFLGSIAASINVKTLGNKTSVDFNEIDRIIQNLLK
jgi:bifunctional ADP-heptose synthase (sugar kinase/adenylyltransferase)